MLTVDFRRLGLLPGHRLLDLGCGGGRHAFEALRQRAKVVAFDLDGKELHGAAEMLAAIHEEGSSDGLPLPGAVQGTALALPFADGAFDRVIASEVLEHIPDDRAAIVELVRVLRPGGTIAVTVPRWFPEKVCWTLSDTYHANEGGHVRIYRAPELLAKLRVAGLEPIGSHHAHALHSPYWWLKCALGVHNEGALPVRLYHGMLVWDITRRPLVTRTVERALNPLLGKSLVVYARKVRVRAGAHTPATAGIA